ncbi:hypothetical protein QQZ08_000214 [Neonectria magnoliae]|uniref:Ribosomal RNA methyltransferase FtsJ domain-containing protein n=1 Tax=Neonectria magnoliae TaxID=2732573 RepID=A0ABR1ILE7_9HYPO
MSSDTDQSSQDSPRNSPASLEPTVTAGQSGGDGQEDDDARFFRIARASKKIKEYASEKSVEFRRLQELRKKGWESTEGDEHFKKQRNISDKPSVKNARYFYNMMQVIGKDLQRSTKAFNVLHRATQPAILDMCMAPGGFVACCLGKYPNARVRALSLPVEQGGHEVLLERADVQVDFVDVTMLAGDMGITKDDIPADHPDAGSFLLEQRFSAGEKFDLALCDGQVLRTHERLEWREPNEARRLTSIQLALSLEHLNPGGTMVILLHKLEAWGSLKLLNTLSKFSDVKLFKHRQHHSIRSSFYAVAKNIQADGELATMAVADWKREWKIASLGTTAQCAEAFQPGHEDVQRLLDEFGERMLVMGRAVWGTQATALEQASFIKGGQKA